MIRNSFKISLLFAFLLAMLQGYGQKKKVKNLPNFDRKTIHFGFTIGVNTADFVMQNDLSEADSLLILQTDRQSGFNLGIISDLHLHPNLSLRFVPALSFAQRNLEYTWLRKTGKKEKSLKPVESTYIDLPLNLKFRSARLNNFAAYLVGGGKYSIDLASQHDVDNTLNPPSEQVVKLARNSYYYEAGFGTDFFLEYFKFGAEIKYSVGINDVHLPDDTDFSRPIKRLFPTMLLISLTFEG